MEDIVISNNCIKKNIREIAKDLGLTDDDIVEYGKYKCKIKQNNITTPKKGKLVLVTAINPTPFGEGKTTISIGLIDALKHIGENAIGVLREPSLGPVFGLKGGATGGGYSQVVPMEDINLHFTGDLHAITSANNLISAAIDNHLYNGNALNIDPKTITFRRCLDVNDRALRDVVTSSTDMPQSTAFDITAASEVMTIFCLSKDLNELRYNLGNIMIGKTFDGKPVYTRDLKLEGALTVILKDAFDPNLVQTLENNPVIIHGGPFANIAHGCNTIVATNLALRLADYVVTEAGFGADLGAEKFMDIKCRKAGLVPNCIVLTCTIRALKYNGGVEKDMVQEENLSALADGLSNLEVHISNLKKYTSHIIVCLNKFNTDTSEEIELIREFCNDKCVEFSTSEAYSKGGVGAMSLANKVREMCKLEENFNYLYDVNSSIPEKINTIAREIYHAGAVNYSDKAIKSIEYINMIGESDLPICIAKTQYSISDDPKKLGYPKDYEIFVRDIELHTGSGFITVFLGKILTMPGLPKIPNYEKIDLNEDNEVVGLF